MEANPFGARAVRLFLREVRDLQSKARGIMKRRSESDHRLSCDDEQYRQHHHRQSIKNNPGFSPAGSRKELIAVVEIEGVSNGSFSVNDDFIDQGSKKPFSFKGESTNINQLSRFLKDMKVLLLDKVYVVNVLGYITYNFVIGAYSYWGPKAGYNIYHMRFLLDACRDTTLIILMIAVATSLALGIKTEVIRGGRRVEISIFDIVVGDVIPLKIGDQVPADGVLISGQSLAIDESNMTGTQGYESTVSDVWLQSSRWLWHYVGRNF